MPEYGLMDQGFPGMIVGVDGHNGAMESWVAQEEIEFGAPCFTYEGEDKKCWNIKRDIAIFTLDADLVTDNILSITVNGTQIDTPFDTDHDTTIDNAIANIEAAIAGSMVTATDATNNRELTIYTRGSNITVTGVVTAGASQANVTVVYTTDSVFIGIARSEHSSTLDSTGVYEKYDMVTVAADCKICVDTIAPVNANTQAYVIFELVNQGKFTDVASGNYDCNCYFDNSITVDGIAVVSVNKMFKDNSPQT